MDLGLIGNVSQVDTESKITAINKQGGNAVTFKWLK